MEYLIGSIAFLFFLIAGDLCLRFLRRSRQPKRRGKLGSKESVYLDLRDRILKGTRDQFGLGEPPVKMPVWAVLMETGFKEGSYTLVAMFDGSSSIYFSNGGGIIGGGGDDIARRAAIDFVRLTNLNRDHAKKTKEFPLPTDGLTTFYLIYDDEVHTAMIKEQDLGRNLHALSPLFHAGHILIAELRILSEKNMAKQ
jgi:hypothetical protein